MTFGFQSNDELFQVLWLKEVNLDRSSDEKVADDYVSKLYSIRGKKGDGSVSVEIDLSVRYRPRLSFSLSDRDITGSSVL